MEGFYNVLAQFLLLIDKRSFFGYYKHEKEVPFMNPINEITVLINAIRDLCDVGICYYDLKNFFNYNKYGVQNNRGHYCEFCKRARHNGPHSTLRSPR